MTSRPYQVVVWGTTGVVGRLVAEHIARDYQKQGLKWAMAGRNQQKLESVRQNLTSIDPSIKNVPILVADVSDKQALEDMTKSTKVVLATAGPFALFGTPVVEACVATGTNYCDITGESNWVRKMIRQFDEKAKSKGIRIVHMAGFDSIPSDLGAFLVADHLQKQYHKACSKVETIYTELKGGLSGGTIISLFGAMFEEKTPDVKGFTDPYGLDPPNSSRGPDKGDSAAPGYSELHRCWFIPFLMAPVNTRVVRRSNALQNHAYGKNFSYREAQKVPGRISAYIGSLVFFLLGAASALGPVRTLLLKVLPKPGDMPKRELLEGGTFKATVVGLSDEKDSGKEPVRVEAEVKAQGDPGYWATSRMLLESALCIVEQEEELNASENLKAGVLTPATAFGHVLVKRLNKSDMFSFKITKP